MASQWVRLKRHLPHRGLNPGAWYPVVSIDETTGIITVDCEELREEFEVHKEYVTISNQSPTRTTIFLPSTFQPVQPGKPPAKMKYEAVCPKGHHLGNISSITNPLSCPECGTEYPTEFK